MKGQFQAALRPRWAIACGLDKTLFKNCLKISAAVIAATVLSSAPQIVAAQSQSNLQPLVVRYDRGGVLETRLRQLRELRESGRPVRITGNACYSTCTMLLGLPQTCISPNTTFGFHGPSSWGSSLDPQTFEWASSVIAHYYPPALKSWYMREGRYRINTMYRVRGSEIIRMGIRAC